MSNYANILIVDNYTAISVVGISEFENTLVVDVIPTESDANANGKSYMLPVVLTNGTDTITTVATAWDVDTLTLAYSAPAGGLPGPVTVICAPNALVHRTLAFGQMELNEDPYTTVHYPVIGVHNHLYAGSYMGNDHTVYLSTPVAYPDYESIDFPLLHAPKTSIFLRFDSSSQTVSFVAPSGYTLIWADASPPVLSSGRTKLLIEFQYSKGSNSFILGSWRAFA